jgi:hypothetical protein
MKEAHAVWRVRKIQMHRFVVNGLSTSSPFISVENKPITIWLRTPIDAAGAERAAEFLREFVEDIEVVASEAGTIRLS